jgi:hypothetical protein
MTEVETDRQSKVNMAVADTDNQTDSDDSDDESISEDDLFCLVKSYKVSQNVN